MWYSVGKVEKHSLFLLFTCFYLLIIPSFLL